MKTETKFLGFLAWFLISCTEREIAPTFEKPTFEIKKQECPGQYCDDEFQCANEMICTHNQCIILCSDLSECPFEAKVCSMYEQYMFCGDNDGLPFEFDDCE